MRALLLTTALGAAVALSAPAFAQDASAPPATDTAAPAPKHMAKPMGSGASNITPADTHSEIAHKLPVPAVGANAGANAYLKAAKMALAKKRTGEAQESLEMAETRLLTRSTDAGTAQNPDDNVRVQHISAALQAIAGKDMAAATSAIDAAMEGAPEDAPPAPMSHKMMHRMKHQMKKAGPPPPADGTAPPDSAPTPAPGSPPPPPPPG